MIHTYVKLLYLHDHRAALPKDFSFVTSAGFRYHVKKAEPLGKPIKLNMTDATQLFKASNGDFFLTSSYSQEISNFLFNPWIQVEDTHYGEVISKEEARKFIQDYHPQLDESIFGPVINV